MENFRTYNQDQPLLLPPNLHDWVPKNDLVHFVIEVVEYIEISVFHYNVKGTGSAQYHPRMMLALLIYCYAKGIFGSRRIEQATYRDICVRYLTADQHPDHDTIAKFRRENFDAIAAAFLEVLKMARELKLLKVGTISVDGTKIKANASINKNVRYERAKELEKQLELDIQELLEKATAADEREEIDGQKLPDEIARREVLKKKMQQAQRKLKEKAIKKAEKEQAEYERKVRDRNNRKGSSKGCHIRKPKDTPENKNQINLTDADSEIMRKNKRSSYEQAYNAQLSVDANGSQLILSCPVSTCASDRNELVRDVKSIPEEIGRPTAVLGDNGYASEKEVHKLQEDGMEVLVSVHKEAKHDRRRYDYRPQKKNKEPEKEDGPYVKQWIKDMKARMETDEARKKYRLRKQTVEPAFGIIKQVMGFRQFMLRGIEKVSGEWNLVALAYNMRRLFNLKMA